MADLRKLKDEATKLLQKGKLDKALEAYCAVIREDPKDLSAELKCGEIHRKLGHKAEALASYVRVAQVNAEQGLLLKAIAACKLVLEIDPEHTETQKMLADLYAKKTGRSPSATAAVTGRSVAAASAASDDDIVAVEEEASAELQLPTIPLFSELPKNAFIQLMEQMTMRSVLPDEVIITQGAVDDSMFIISSGRVKITRTSEAGTEVILARLSDGAFFGEMALLSESPRTASVIAEDETWLFEVSRETIGGVTGNFPSVANIMLKFYRQRLLANLMATSPIFRPLDPEQRKGLIEKFKSRQLAPRETILQAGQTGDGLYMLLSGQAEVSTQAAGKRKVLAHLREGDVFGEMSLLQNQPVSADVKTLRKSIVLKLPKRTFNEIVATHPHLLAKIAEISAEREKTNAAILAGRLTFGDEGLVVV